MSPLARLLLHEQLGQGQVHRRGHLHGALIAGDDDDAAPTGLDQAGVVGGCERLVSGPLGTGTMGCDEGVGSEALRGLDRPEPGTLRGADDGLGLPRLTGLDLLDGVGDG